MLNYFKERAEKKDIKKMISIFEKNVEKNRKSIDYILKNTKFQKHLDDFIKKEGLGDNYSCYNYNYPNEIKAKIEEKDCFNDKNIKKNYNKVINAFRSYIDRNINFKQQGIRMSNIVEENIEKRKKKENDDSLNSLSKKRRITLEELEELALNKNTDSKIINQIFDKLLTVPSIDTYNSSKKKTYIRLFSLIINHPKMNRSKIIHFIQGQTVDKNCDFYIEVKRGDEIDLNILKKIIIQSKILKYNEIILLTKIPYISLWNDILENYFLYSYHIVDFLKMIFQYNLEDDKKRILRFLNANPQYFSPKNGNKEIEYLIQSYLKS